MQRLTENSKWLVSLLVVVSATLWPHPSGAVEHAALDSLLGATVQDERVDYGAILGVHFAQLAGYLDGMARVDVSQLSRSEQLAFYINVYNATMISAVAPDWKEGFSPTDDDFAVFDEPHVRLKSGNVSLNHLEHEIIRKTFNDPRIHAALVCAALSCPPLLPRAYRAEDLDEVLDANMRRFVRDSTRNRVDDSARTLHLSSIFDWYAEDFGGQDALSHYVSKYLGRDVSDYAVVFLPYDWTLNATRTSE
jgi:hypothetical protein